MTQTTGLVAFLSSSMFPGIGVKRAESIVAVLGDGALKVLDEEPERFARAAKLPVGKVREIATNYRKNKGKSTAMAFMLGAGVPAGLALRLWDKYEDRVVDVLKGNPYILAYEMENIGFLTADAVAQKVGMPAWSPQRKKAAMYYALQKSGQDGHCYLTVAELLASANELLPETTVETRFLDELVHEGLIVKEEDRCALPYHVFAERSIASFVRDRLSAPSPFGKEEINREQMGAAEKALGVTFSEEQIEALQISLDERLLIITGGPGCGKTTIVRGICALFRDKEIVLCAPTGKAAQRMSEVSGLPASTIHRLLGLRPGVPPKHNESNQIDADIIIVDETSMLDVRLAATLLAAVKEDTKLVLVGDADQLPSVGPGRVLADLLTVPGVPKVVLTKLFRQAELSMIATGARDIRENRTPRWGATGGDVSFAIREDVSGVAAAVELNFSHALNDFAEGDISVLTPMNKGPIGTLELNQRLQLSMRGKNGPYPGAFVVGDRVCQRKNDYKIHEAGVFNGDTGTVLSVAFTGAVLVKLWDGREVLYDKQAAKNLSLAYALTIHRSQGSEVPCVILVLHDSHYHMLERQLIYTAVTRAKKRLVVIGTQRALGVAVRQCLASKRNTYLAERLR